MSQYVSRIHIKVSSPDIWTKFEEEDDAGFDLADLSKTNQTSFSISGDWSCVEDELTGIVKALSKTLEQDGIIIADTTNINVDPYDFCVYYFGGYVQVECFTIWDDRKKCEMFSETNIDDIAGWLSYGEFMVSSEEKEILFKHGITSIDGHYESFSTDLDLPSKIYLRETSFEGRDQIIEKSIIGEEVYFVHAKDSYDPMRL